MDWSSPLFVHADFFALWLFCSFSFFIDRIRGDEIKINPRFTAQILPVRKTREQCPPSTIPPSTIPALCQ